MYYSAYQCSSVCLSRKGSPKLCHAFIFFKKTFVCFSTKIKKKHKKKKEKVHSIHFCMQENFFNWWFHEKLFFLFNLLLCLFRLFSGKKIYFSSKFWFYFYLANKHKILKDPLFYFCLAIYAIISTLSFQT